MIEFNYYHDHDRIAKTSSSFWHISWQKITFVIPDIEAARALPEIFQDDAKEKY